MTLNTFWMQSALTVFGLGPFSFWEWLPMLGGLVLVALAVASCVPGRRRAVNPRVFSHLLHQVHERREQLFLRKFVQPLPRAWPGAARERILELVRERLRACGVFHRDTSE